MSCQISIPNGKYIDHLNAIVSVVSDDAQVAYHRKSALKTCFLILVGTRIFMDKSATYVDVVYLKYFMDLEQIHKYN